MENLVGLRFYPTGEELINHYLKNKNLGKTWLVDNMIGEINICSYQPFLLPSLSKIKSSDHVWFFFSPKEYTSKKTTRKRTTGSGYWKATGVDRKIKDNKGNGVEIGIKKTLVYHEGKVPNGVWTPWAMHEYDITCLPHDQRNYVICKIFFKGDDGDISYGGNSLSGPSDSSAFDSNTVGTISTPLEFEQSGLSVGMSPLEFEQSGLYENNSNWTMPMNEPEDLSFSVGPNSDAWFSDNNTNYVHPQTPYNEEYWNGMTGYDHLLFPQREF